MIQAVKARCRVNTFSRQNICVTSYLPEHSEVRKYVATFTSVFECLEFVRVAELTKKFATNDNDGGGRISCVNNKFGSKKSREFGCHVFSAILTIDNSKNNNSFNETRYLYYFMTHLGVFCSSEHVSKSTITR